MADVEPTFLQQRIRQAVRESGKAREHFDRLLQEKLGTKGKPIYDIDRGKSKNPSHVQLRAIAEVFDKPVSFFTDAEVEPRLPASSTADDDTVEIIALDLSLSMGPGTLIEQFVEEERVRMGLSFIQAITRTPSDRLRLVRGIGDSMEPTLRTGDRVMVDINERQLARAHGVYWIDYLGTHGIKRLRASGRGKVMVMSDNPLVPDFEADAEDLRIEGRVIWFAREL